MKIFKRVMTVVFAIVCLAIVVEGIRLSQLGKTVDCSGMIRSIDIDNNLVRVTSNDDTVEYLLKIKFFTSVKNLDNERIGIDEMEIGDRITANYRGQWKDADTPLTATYIKVSK